VVEQRKKLHSKYYLGYSPDRALAHKEWFCFHCSGLVWCETSVKEDPFTVNGVENYLQGVQDGDDEELVVFHGSADPITTKALKRLKITKDGQLVG
jgi:hypothetical protein